MSTLVETCPLLPRCSSTVFPVGNMVFHIDSLSAFFLIPICILSVLAVIYSRGYLRGQQTSMARGIHTCLLSLFAVSMALVVMAQDAIMFLVCWEIMTVLSYFLVTFDSEKEEVCQAGRLYLVLSHVGVACLFALFMLLGGTNGNTQFDSFSVMGPSATGTAIFLLAVIGFGLKAGFIPLHVWLPKAHPAAPSHISALMSGVMIKLGIYGLMRVLCFVQHPPLWWGVLLIIIGMLSGILGIFYALTQSDLKKLLAYSSIENIGIIALGIGTGLIGRSTHTPFLTVLGFSGALLHTLNHALFKGLLFFGAGAIQHATGTRNIEQLGGLLKKMRLSGTAFIVGAAAICGLPPLNGFVSELLIYSGALYGGATLNNVGAAATLFAAVAALALIGGLAVACFTKAIGIIFLGEPRTTHAAAAHEVEANMRIPMMILAGCCVLIGLVGPVFIHWLSAPVAQLSALTATETAQLLHRCSSPFRILSGMVFVLLLLAGALALLRRHLLAGRSVTTAGTWDCGYVAPTARMQYSATSFAGPILAIFPRLLRPKLHFCKLASWFPQRTTLHSSCADLIMRWLYEPGYRLLCTACNRLKVLQHGNTHLYILYILIILLLFMLWKVV